MKIKIHFRYILTLFLLLSCFNSKAQEKKQGNSSYVDSAIYYFNKSQTTNGIDSVAFFRGLIMIDSIPTDDVSIKRIEWVAENLNGRKKYVFTVRLEDALLSRFVNAHEPYKAINFGKEIINRYDASPNVNARVVFLTILAQLRIPFRTSDKLMEGFDYYTEKLKLYLQRNDSAAISICYYVRGGFYRTIGLTDLSVYYYKKSILYIDVNDSLSDDVGFVGRAGWANNTAVIGQLLIDEGKYNESISCLNAALYSITHYQKDNDNLDYALFNIAYAKLMLNETDSVLDLLNSSIEISLGRSSYVGVVYAYQGKGLYFLKMNQLDSAEYYFQECNRMMDEYSLPSHTTVGILTPNYYLALVRIKQNRYRDAEELIKKELPGLVNLRGEVLKEYKLLIEVYLNLGDVKNADETFRKYNVLNGELQTDERKNRSMSVDTEQKIADAENTISNLQNEKHVASLTRNYVIGIAALLLLIAIVVYNRNRLIKKTNAALSKTLRELNETQVQLVKSEKMAAFGVMASRVSHEIQNPLNFVNNFSELSCSLVEDVINSQNEEEKKQSSVLLMDNLLKINEHGKRAAVIVKQLQEHTRAGTAHQYFEG